MVTCDVISLQGSLTPFTFRGRAEFFVWPLHEQCRALLKPHKAVSTQDDADKEMWCHFMPHSQEEVENHQSFHLDEHRASCMRVRVCMYDVCICRLARWRNLYKHRCAWVDYFALSCYASMKTHRLTCTGHAPAVGALCKIWSDWQ